MHSLTGAGCINIPCSISLRLCLFPEHWAIELKRCWRAPRQVFCRLFCIISVIHYFLHSGRMHSSGNSHGWTERWLFLITQVSKPQAKEDDAYTSHKRSSSLCWAGELLRMFIADNGPCAGGHVPSHVLEEGLQMSPATGALPLPQWVWNTHWIHSWSEVTSFPEEPLEHWRVITISPFVDSSLSLTCGLFDSFGFLQH